MAKAPHLRMAHQVVKVLGIERKNTVLFAAVAAALGKEWTPGTDGKKRGYALVMEYGYAHGITLSAASPRAKKFKNQHSYRKSLPAVAKDDFLSTFEWRKLRMIVLTKRGARCECCGKSPKDGVTVINIDHIKPRKLFPELALEETNLQVLCHECNHGKGNWDQTDWRGIA